MIYILGLLGKESTARRLGIGNPAIIAIDHPPISFNVQSADYLVRYGITSYPRLEDQFQKSHILNKSSAISNNLNKLTSLIIMKELGVRVPEVYFKNRLTEATLPVLGRRLNHRKGRGIRLITSTHRLRNFPYYVQFIPSETEYRVHVFKDFAYRASIKIKSRDDADPIRRNYDRGWDFQDVKYVNQDFDYIQESVKAVKAMELDFGAVDVLIHKETSEPYVLEVNTAPRLNKLGRKLFKYQLLKYAGLR